jgi:L-Ala-D/L-Glu epimerase / N-acetyl-D-glutamate racemase
VTTIETIRCHRVSAPLHSPFVTALRTATSADSLLIEIVDSDGASGWGEAPQVWQVTGESFAGAQAAVEGPVSAAITGRDPADLTEVLRWVQASIAANHGAKAAVDVALHDLAARRLGVSLHAYLGSTAETVRTDVTISALPGEHSNTAERRVAEGFDVLKLKVGTGDAITDVARVKTIRRAVGPDVVIRLDANQGWSPRTAVQVIGGIEDAGCRVELVEQPVAAADLDGLAWVSARVNTPILADESVYGVRDLVEVIRRRAADMVNVKLAKCGGLANARTLLEVARAHGLGTVVGSMMETHVGVGAAAALVAAVGTSHVSDLDAAWWLASSPVVGGATYGEGVIVLPDAPGLGITGLS